MPRVGLDRDKVVAVAAAILDRGGIGALTLAGLADELGVRAPSLYNHIDGLEALYREIAIRGIEQLAEACRTSVMGRTGIDALRAMAHAYRSFALQHPGVYPLTQVANSGDPLFDAASGRALEPVFAVLTSLGFEGHDLVHATRALRSALHGFSLLESDGGFGIDLEPAESFQRMIDVLAAGLTSLGR